jgi:hypothetical protein
MAKKKNVTISPETMAFYESLQDGGFQQAAIAAGPSTQPSKTALTPNQNLSLESDIVRAISGGTEEQVQETFEKIEKISQPTLQGSGNETIDPDEDPDGDGDGDGDDGGDDKGDGNGDDKGDGKDTYTATDGTPFKDRALYLEYQASLDGKREKRQSAFDLLYEEFSRYGLGGLVEDLRGFITDSTISPSEFAIKLRGTKAYSDRFFANPARIAKGLKALTEAEYLDLEDSYQDIMRRYGLPESYYTKGDLGRQQGFEDLIGFDVSPRELEERIATAQDKVRNAPPEVLESIKSFYGDSIRDGDILSYVLDPKNAIDSIKRKVAAAEIGAGARQAGLGLGRERAEELGRYGVTGEQSRAGFQQIAGGLERGGQLAAIYQQQPYGQETAEQEIFGMTGAPEARKRRQKIIKSEEATFGGQTGLTGGALSRDRAGQY